MQGRYGSDNFNRFLSVFAMILIVLNLFLRSALLNWIVLAMLVYLYFRMFSRNFSKRTKENEKYMQLSQPIATWIWRVRSKFGKYGVSKRARTKDKTHKIFRCPECKQKVRVPRGKGKIEIRCPKCGRQFVKRS
jgi:ribosomal protein L37AE/L43A